MRRAAKARPLEGFLANKRPATFERAFAEASRVMEIVYHANVNNTNMLVLPRKTKFLP